jgi:hypothetical protein
MVNSWIDAPVRTGGGAYHREKRHNMQTTPFDACSIYGDKGTSATPRNLLVARMVLQHLRLDGLITPLEDQSWQWNAVLEQNRNERLQAAADDVKFKNWLREEHAREEAKEARIIRRSRVRKRILYSLGIALLIVGAYFSYFTIFVGMPAQVLDGGTLFIYEINSKRSRQLR